MEIAAWLQSLGLERYEPNVRANDIDVEILLRLTAEDLKDLGVNWSAIAGNYSVL